MCTRGVFQTTPHHTTPHHTPHVHTQYQHNTQHHLYTQQQQHTTHSPQHTAHSTQPTAHNTQHTHNTRHTTHDTLTTHDTGFKHTRFQDVMSDHQGYTLMRGLFLKRDSIGVTKYQCHTIIKPSNRQESLEPFFGSKIVFVFCQGFFFEKNYVQGNGLALMLLLETSPVLSGPLLHGWLGYNMARTRTQK